MLAKLAKADGHIDESEIAAAEQAFERLELTPANREICIRAFRAAKADYHTIFDYAESFASVARGVVLRELMYDILWDVACADGEVSASERRILEMIVTQLRIRPSLFTEECHRRLNEQRSSRRSYSYEPSPYDILGCDSSATDDELRRAYRAQAKKHHPDLLRAQGLPEEMITRATEQMARINNAWEEIKRARGI
jgi:DnaJ like chaperone protein